MYKIQWTKDAGRKPSKKLLEDASTLARPDTQDHLVVAMAMRPEGVTQPQVISLFGHPHRNKIKRLVQDNKVQAQKLPSGSRLVRIRLIKR